MISKMLKNTKTRGKITFEKIYIVRLKILHNYRVFKSYGEAIQSEEMGALLLIVMIIMHHFLNNELSIPGKINPTKKNDLGKF